MKSIKVNKNLTSTVYLIGFSHRYVVINMLESIPPGWAMIFWLLFKCLQLFTLKNGPIFVHTGVAHSRGMSNSSKNSIFLQGWVHSSKDKLEIWSCLDFTSYSITLFYTKFTFGGAIFILLKTHNKYCWSELLSIIRVSGGLTICDIPPWMSRLTIKYLVYRHGKRIDPGFAKKTKLVSSNIILDE